MTDEAWDMSMTAIRSVAVVEPERGRAERLRVRCHAALRTRGSRRAWEPLPPRWRPATEAALAAGISATFLTEVVHRALRLYGF